ncbi:MAG: C25 family cysteine peptidase [Ignavibacterium sp.]
MFCFINNLSAQNGFLHNSENQYDYIIITIPDYVQSCNQFATHKETNLGLRTLVVDTTMIFNEFNSFPEPQENIREFTSYAGTFWTDPKPKFILIVGRINDIPNFKIPYFTHPNYYFNSDFYYTQNKFESDSISMDFFVGRLPCRNNLELISYFNKVINYETLAEHNDWENNCLLISDTVPTFDFLNSTLDLRNVFPSYISSKILTIDTTSGYYGNKDSVINFVNVNGVSSIWFEGLGTQDFFISEEFLNLSDLNLFENLDKYFLTVFIHAQFNIFDTNTNLAREFLFKENSGSIASIHHLHYSFWQATRYFQTIWAQ